jgi:hypothetical protein
LSSKEVASSITCAGQLLNAAPCKDFIARNAKSDRRGIVISVGGLVTFREHKGVHVTLLVEEFLNDRPTGQEWGAIEIALLDRKSLPRLLFR